VASRQWFLVTVSLTWAPGRAGGRELADRVIDLLLEDEGRAGARVGHHGAGSMYYRIDVRAESGADAQERALAPAGRIMRELGGTIAVTDVQTMTEADLDDYQRRIRYVSPKSSTE
jgi:hypothetical protein